MWSQKWHKWHTLYIIFVYSIQTVYLKYESSFTININDSTRVYTNRLYPSLLHFLLYKRTGTPIITWYAADTTVLFLTSSLGSKLCMLLKRYLLRRACFRRPSTVLSHFTHFCHELKTLQFLVGCQTLAQYIPNIWLQCSFMIQTEYQTEQFRVVRSFTWTQTADVDGVVDRY